MYEMQPILNEFCIQGFHSIYYFEFSKDFSHTPERHNFWEMVYVDRGEILAITNGIACNLEQGQAIFHEPMEIHAHASNNKVSNDMLVISFSVNDDSAIDFFRKKTFTLDKTAKTLLTLFIEEAKNALGKLPDSYSDKSNLDFSNAPFGSTQLMQCYFTEFLIKLMRCDSTSGVNIRGTESARAIAETSIAEMIVDYLKENLYQPLTLKEVCEHFMLGKSQLSKIFKEHTSSSPMEHYNFLKIREAKKLLRENAMSVSEISDALGYSSIHIFSRAFKQHTGFSPTAYRQSIL